jgi:DNA mismatch repair ATPase MutS
MFGQLHHLAALGLPVPARAARLPLADRIFTHFERREDATDLRGKLEDELMRIRAILDRATHRSVVIMNESLTSTTLDDALLVGEEVVRRIIERGVVGVVVSFLDELSRLDEATVSMVSEVDPADPAQRTFRVTRRPADGRAYAAAIARRHGLTYERVLERVAA